MSDKPTTAQGVVKVVQTMNGKQKLLFGVGLVAMLAIAAPVVSMAFNAVESLAGLILLGTGTVAFVAALPMLSRKWKNAVLGMMFSEAQRNPILVLRNQSLDRHKALENARRAAAGMIGKLNSLADSLSEFSQKHGKYPDSKKIYDRMLPLVQRVQERIKKADEALHQFDIKIDEKNDEWQIMLKVGDLKNALREAGVNDALELLEADTAFTAVRDAVNDELAQLDSLLASEDLAEIRALPAPSTDAFDLGKAIDITPKSDTLMVPARNAKKR